MGAVDGVDVVGDFEGDHVGKAKDGETVGEREGDIDGSLDCSRMVRHKDSNLGTSRRNTEASDVNIGRPIVLSKLRCTWPFVLSTKHPYGLRNRLMPEVIITTSPSVSFPK